MKASLEEMLQTKKKDHQRVRSEGTAITVPVDNRSQKYLEKFCGSMNINWAPVEKQLRKWSNLLRIGKRLRVVISFNYRQEDDNSVPASRRVEKRSRVSATSRMLAERDAHIDAEEESTGRGRPSTWNLVYSRMRCGVRSCPLKSDWCWEDPKDHKHYKLRSSHLERLIDYVDNGGSLEGHDDVPKDIRRDLVLESQTGRNSKKADNTPTAGGPYPPISINVLPAQTARAPMVAASPPRSSSPYDHPVLPRPREAAVKGATEKAYKADFRRICEVTLENQLDLELVLEDPDPSFFVKQGVKTGTARRFVRDIYEWAKSLETRPPFEGCVEYVLDEFAN